MTGHDHYAPFKVKEKRGYITLGELAKIVGRDRSRICQLELAGVLPAPIRGRSGRLRVRLYSPAQVRKIVAYFERNGRSYRRLVRSDGNLSTEEQLALARERYADCPKRDRPYYKRRVRYLRDKLKRELTTTETSGKLSSNRRRE